MLRGADLDVDTSLTAGGISVNASNADSDINLAGTLNLTQNGSFNFGRQMQIQSTADIDVVGDLVMSGGAANTQHLIDGDIDVTGSVVLRDTGGDDDVDVFGNISANQVVITSELSGATGTGEMSIEDATIAATQGITTTIGNIDIDNSTVNATSGQWTATVLRSIDLDVDTTFNALGATLTASNDDAHIHIHGTANLTDDATFDLGGQLMIQSTADVDVDGDFTVTARADEVQHILHGDLDVTDTFSLTDTSGDDDISIQGTLDADQVTLSSQLSGATGTGEMSIEDAAIAATQGITTTIGNIDIDNSTVNATSGQWTATVLRGIDLTRTTLFMPRRRH